MPGLKGDGRKVAGADSPAQAAPFAEAVAHYQAQRFDEAEQALRRLLALDPRHGEGLHLLGVLEAKALRFEAAADLFRRAALASPRADGPRYNLGNALKESGRLEEAVTAYRNVLVINPDHAPAHNNLGVTLDRLGRHEEAAAAYRRAFALKPDFVEARYNLGNALRACGLHAEAVEAYAEALALRPGYAEAHNNQGVALKLMGRFQAAAEAFARAIQARHDYGEAYSNLGAALQSLGRHSEALQAYQGAIAISPGLAQAYNNLGTVLKDMGRYPQAQAAFAEGLALAPDHADTLINSGITLAELGQVPEAMRMLDRALEVAPGSAQAWQARGDLKTFTADDPDIARMDALLRAADRHRLDVEDRARLAFTLGKAWLEIGDADQAFAYLDRGNRLKRSSIEFDGEGSGRWMARIAQAFPQAEIARLAGRGDPSELPIFIVGMPRSGSSLVEQILASHPLVHGAGELDLVERQIRWASRDGQSLDFPWPIKALPEAAVAAMGARYVAQLSAFAPGRPRVIDKLPGNFHFAGLIHAMLPNARIIHCARDPVDTCLSCYSKLFSDGQHFTYDQVELGRYYRDYQGLMRHWRAVLPSDRFMDLQYEDLIEDQQGQTRRLLAFLGLDWDEACLNFHQTERAVRTASVTQVRRPLYRSSVERWRPYAPHLGPLLGALGVADRESLSHLG